jgi:diguanylate cyclase (GGDEF)-like protein
MNGKHVNVLHIEDDPGDASQVARMLGEGNDLPVRLTQVGRLAKGLGCLAEGRFDLVLLDLDLPDSAGIETLAKVRAQAPGLPIIVLTARDDVAQGASAVRAGAQDYLIKAELTRSLLTHAIRYALGGPRGTPAARELPGTDPVTGFSDRQAFVAMAQRDLKLTHRRGGRAALLVIHTGRLRPLDDGTEPEPRQAVFALFARNLRDTIRGTDLIGRVGPDDFAVLALDTTAEGVQALSGRVRKSLSSVARDPDWLAMRASVVNPLSDTEASAEALLARTLNEAHASRCA